MACKTETTQIGDHEYDATQWSATKALLMKFKLAKIFGASITTIVSAVGSESDEDQMKAISEGFTSLFANNSPEEIVDVMKECIVGVARDGTRMTATSFDEHFSGEEMINIYKVFIFVVKVNYSDLLKGQWAESALAKLEKL